MNIILNTIDRSSRFIETLAVVAIFGYCGLMLAEVVARAQAKSFSFSWEFSQYAMAAIFALAAGPAIRTAVHVRITLLNEILPPKAAKWLDVAANAIALIIVTAIVVAVWDKFYSSFSKTILAATVTQTPLYIPQFFIVLGFGQFWLDLLARLIRRATDKDYEWRETDATKVSEDA